MCTCGNPLCNCYKKGYLDGNAAGYVIGYEAGIAIGEEFGYRRGYKDGIKYGYGLGYVDGKKAGLEIGENIANYKMFKLGYEYGYKDCYIGHSYDPDRHKVEYYKNLDFNNWHSSSNASKRLEAEAVLGFSPSPYSSNGLSTLDFKLMRTSTVLD